MKTTLLIMIALSSALTGPAVGGALEAPQPSSLSQNAAAPAAQAAFWALKHYFEADAPDPNTLFAALHFTELSEHRDEIIKKFAVQAEAKATRLFDKAS